MNSRFVTREVAVVIYPNYDKSKCISYYQYVEQGAPILIRTLTHGIARAKKVYVFNNTIAVLSYHLDEEPGQAEIWVGSPAINPTTTTVANLPEIVSKAKVLYDNLFIFSKTFIQYTNDGTSWKSTYYPFFIPDNYYLTAKPFASDSKLYMNSLADTIYADIFGSDADGLVRNTSVTQNALLAHGVNLDDFEIGKPVYMSGSVFKFNEMTRLYETSTDATNCISSVKSKGTPREYLGICCEKLQRGNKNIGEMTVEFATHGDVYFKVDDSASYEIGDIVLIDKTILGEDVILTGLIKRMIAGKVTAKINKSYVSVFMGD
jgi:hypothetical protein